MKNLKGRNIRANRQTNRSVELSVDLAKGLQKREYRKEMAKLTDRFVPVIKSFEEFEGLLGLLEGDLTLEEHGGILTRLGESGSKVVIEVRILRVGEECDCLKFRLKEGDPLDFAQTLKLFDEKVEE